MQRFGNGDRGLNTQNLDIRRGAQARAQERLQRLYRLQSARQYRDAVTTTGRFSKVAMVGSGLLLAMIGFGLIGIFVLLQGAATGYAMLTRDLPSLSQISNHASFKT